MHKEKIKMECKNLKNIILELQEAATCVDEDQVNSFADAIIAAKRIFVAGAGRSGFCARGFSNRLLHLGFDVTISPENTIGSMSKVYIQLPGNTRMLKEGQKSVESIQPVGSMFEQLSWLTYDTVIMTLRDKMGQTNDDMIARHANLE